MEVMFDNQIHHFKMENEDILVSHWLSTTWNLDFSHFEYCSLSVIGTTQRYDSEVPCLADKTKWKYWDGDQWRPADIAVTCGQNQNSASAERQKAGRTLLHNHIIKRFLPLTFKRNQKSASASTTASTERENSEKNLLYNRNGPFRWG